MQLTTLTALLATVALTATAAPSPSSDLSSRQGTPRVRATFYRDTQCGRDGSPWADDYVFVQSTVTGLAGCQDLPASSTYQQSNSVYFNETSVTKTCKFVMGGTGEMDELTMCAVRFFNLPCAQLTNTGSGGHIDIAPGFQQGCQTFKIASYVTL
jgi:hypothetical protein